jgi:hypothetical protein
MTLITNQAVQVGSLVADVANKSIKLNQYNENYPKVIQSDENGYTLQSENKTIYSKWKFKGKNNMSEITIQSKWVKAGVNVKQGDVCIIRSEGKLEPSAMDKTKMEWHFDLELPNGETKDAKFNKKSLENLISGFGTSESSEWLGKEIFVSEIINYQKGAGCTWAVKK